VNLMNNDERYVRATTIKKTYDVAYNTLRRWAEADKIRFKRIEGGKRLYCLSDVHRLYNGGKEPEKKKKKQVCYARVSSQHQKSDLEREIEFLRKEYPTHEIIQDIGSGLNWNRHGFKTLLDQILSGTVEEVVVSYKDRLCRFGYEMFEQVCDKLGTKLVVLNKTEGQVNGTQELSEDLLSIVTVFVARNNGLCSGKNKRKRTNQDNRIEEEEKTKSQKRRATSDESKEDPVVSKRIGKKNLEQLDGNSKVDL